MNRMSAEEQMDLYERLKPFGYLIETRERDARIVVYRHWALVGIVHSFEEAVNVAADDYEQQEARAADLEKNDGKA